MSNINWVWYNSVATNGIYHSNRLSKHNMRCLMTKCFILHSLEHQFSSNCQMKSFAIRPMSTATACHVQYDLLELIQELSHTDQINKMKYLVFFLWREATLIVKPIRSNRNKTQWVIHLISAGNLPGLGRLIQARISLWTHRQTPNERSLCQGILIVSHKYRHPCFRERDFYVLCKSMRGHLRFAWYISGVFVPCVSKIKSFVNCKRWYVEYDLFHLVW